MIDDYENTNYRMHLEERKRKAEEENKRQALEELKHREDEKRRRALQAERRSEADTQRQILIEKRRIQEEKRVEEQKKRMALEKERLHQAEEDRNNNVVFSTAGQWNAERAKQLAERNRILERRRIEAEQYQKQRQRLITERKRQTEERRVARIDVEKQHNYRHNYRYRGRTYQNQTFPNDGDISTANPNAALSREEHAQILRNQARRHRNDRVSAQKRALVDLNVMLSDEPSKDTEPVITALELVKKKRVTLFLCLRRS